MLFTVSKESPFYFFYMMGSVFIKMSVTLLDFVRLHFRRRGYACAGEDTGAKSSPIVTWRCSLGEEE